MSFVYVQEDLWLQIQRICSFSLIIEFVTHNTKQAFYDIDCTMYPLQIALTIRFCTLCQNIFYFISCNCHSPLPDWIADAGELALGVDMGAPQDSRRGILAINSNSN